jgi:hypothetical protein
MIVVSGGKAFSPISVSEQGRVMEVKDLQEIKAHFPIEVSESGIVTELKAEQA